MTRRGEMVDSQTQQAGDAWIGRFNQGVVLFNAGRPAEAEACFRDAAAARPDVPGVWINLGAAIKAQGRLADAIAVLHQGHNHHTTHTDLLAALGTALIDARRLPEALSVFQRLVALRFDHPQALLNLANLYMFLDNAEMAIRGYRVAGLLEPDSPLAANNLGAALTSLNRLDEAAGPYRRAIRLLPGSPEYRKNLGANRLMAGDFAEGLPAYEWRHEQPVWKWKRVFPGRTPWDGTQPLEGRTLLVHFEQGLGDSFQFSRYMAVLKGMGARVVFECQPQLKRVLSGVPGIDALVGHGEPLPDFDYHVPLMSLMLRLGTRPETVPGGVPYIAAEPEHAAAWGRRMAEGEGARGSGREFRIGINWHANALDRSIPLDQFLPLARIPGVRLYSLQQVVGLDQLERLRGELGIVDWTAQMDTGRDGFVDTAAVMANLDLVISCDSAVNHLAGAMGLPVWLVMKWFGDWRWMRIPDHSPWYPTMRLFRSPRRNDWSEVMARVAGEVAVLAARPR